jgi:hypothetical protein
MEIGLTTLLSLGGYTTVVCFFFYKLNEKTIREWREEHSKQMLEWREEHRQDIAKIDIKIDKMDEKWERLFSLFVAQLQKDK